MLRLKNEETRLLTHDKEVEIKAEERRQELEMQKKEQELVAEERRRWMTMMEKVLAQKTD